MVDIKKLKKPSNRKGTPSQQATISQNLLKPPSGKMAPATQNQPGIAPRVQLIHLA
jgi:hypothetical protein